MLLLAATLLTIALDFVPGVDRMPIVSSGVAVPMPASPGEPTVAMPNAAPSHYREVPAVADRLENVRDRIRTLEAQKAKTRPKATLTQPGRIQIEIER